MSSWPIYYKELLNIGDISSNVSICTLWTPKDVITDKLSKDTYSLAGQLYSKRGINFIIRNILANPIINKILLCGADRSNSGEALIKFMKNGVDEKYRVIGDKKCLVNEEISKKALEDFRDNVEVIDMRGMLAVGDLLESLKSKDKNNFWAKPRKFSESKFDSADKFPSEKTTFTTRANFIWEGWIQMLRLIMKFGSRKGMIKIGEVKELVNLISVIEAENPDEPELSNIFEFNKKDLGLYYKDFFNIDKGNESYNYGERIYAYPAGLPLRTFNSESNEKLIEELKMNKEGLRIRGGLDQLAEVFEKYQRYHQDRGLVIAIWNPWTDNVKTGWMTCETPNSKSEILNSKQKQSSNFETLDRKSAGNVPCMVLMQFTYRSKKLHLTAYFRSNDIFSAWPLNSFALRKFQIDFARRIKKKPGFLTTISNCAQIYEINYEKASNIIKKYKGQTFCMADPRSSIMIEVEGKDIIARHMTPDGNLQLDEYRIDGNLRKASSKLMDLLLINNLFSKDFHVADIASELTKAEWCVKNNRKYIQDRDWNDING